MRWWFKKQCAVDEFFVHPPMPLSRLSTSDSVAPFGPLRSKRHPRAAARQPKTSIRLEHALVIDAKCRVLVFLPGDAIASNQQFDVGPHKAPERVLRGTDNRFASDIEAGVDQNRAAGTRLESREQRVVTRVCLLVNRLNTRRHVDMSNGRDFRADPVEPVDPKKLFVFVRN